jgi:hypothetical protein
VVADYPRAADGGALYGVRVEVVAIEAGKGGGKCRLGCGEFGDDSKAARVYGKNRLADEEEVRELELILQHGIMVSRPCDACRWRYSYMLNWRSLHQSTTTHATFPGGKKMKAMSLRLPEDQADQLQAIARVDDMSISDAVREAIDHQIAAKRADKDFQDRLKKRLKEDQEVLRRLAT